jgi:hypothetical protein
MGLMDRLSAGVERVAQEADKAFDRGKTKVGEMQIEMQMDSQAKKLGYLVFDFYRGRQVDQALRQKILDDLTRLEDQLLKSRAEAAAKKEAEAAARAQQAAGTSWAPPTSPMGEQGGPAEPTTPAEQTPPPEQTVSPGTSKPADSGQGNDKSWSAG